MAALPLQQQQQGISTSAATAAPLGGLAATAKAYRGYLYLGPMAAGIAKVSDDIFGLIASTPRTMRTVWWAIRAGYRWVPSARQQGMQCGVGKVLLNSYWMHLPNLTYAEGC